jgi:D-alanyl-D-alanine carboxypeptidase
MVSSIRALMSALAVGVVVAAVTACAPAAALPAAAPATDPVLAASLPTDLTRTVYSNSEYVLLGYVIQRASGQPAPDYLADLFERMGLPATSFPTDTALPSPFSRGYITNGHPTPAAPRDATVSNPLVPWTAGALVSTVPDMTRYAPMMATGAGLPPEIAAQRQAWTPTSTEGIRMQYGLGVRKVGDWIGHEGTMLGYSNTVFYLPAAGATVVVMVNAISASSAPAADLWLDIVQLLYPASLPRQ